MSSGGATRNLFPLAPAPLYTVDKRKIWQGVVLKNIVILPEKPNSI